MKRIGYGGAPALGLLLTLSLLLVACHTFGLGVQSTRVPDAAATAAMATQLSRPLDNGVRPTPTSALDGGYRSFSDPLLGFELQIPLWWETEATPGAVAQFFQRDHTGSRRAALTISALSPGSDSLEAALADVSGGAWGPYIQSVQPTRLGSFDALRVTLDEDGERPPLVWLIVPAAGRAVGLVPGGNPDWIEPMTEVVLDTLRPVDVATSEASLPTPPPLATPRESQKEASTPFCRPSEASVTLSVPTTTFRVGEAVPLTVTLSNGESSGVNLGLIQYRVTARPLIFAARELVPQVHSLSVRPGESDQAAFLLRPEAAGPASLTAVASYEMHALDYSSGSWSRCDSESLAIIVTP